MVYLSTALEFSLAHFKATLFIFSILCVNFQLKTQLEILQLYTLFIKLQLYQLNLMQTINIRTLEPIFENNMSKNYILLKKKSKKRLHFFEKKLLTKMKNA